MLEKDLPALKKQYWKGNFARLVLPKQDPGRVEYETGADLGSVLHNESPAKKTSSKKDIVRG